MTSKRKRTGAHPPPPIPEMPDAYPRRSSRRLKEAPNERTPKIDVTKMASDPLKLTNTKKKEAVWETGEGVEEAMRELSEMEHKLQDAVRTQRLAVESSDLHVKKELSQEPGIRPKVYEPNNDTIATRGNLNGKSKPVDTGPLDEHDAKLAAGDMADAKEEAKEEDGVGRGADRPPPVNSETLPLPWKGRLGYVSTRR
jgi:UV DNA damage endonuclease